MQDYWQLMDSLSKMRDALSKSKKVSVPFAASRPSAAHSTLTTNTQQDASVAFSVENAIVLLDSLETALQACSEHLPICVAFTTGKFQLTDWQLEFAIPGDWNWSRGIPFSRLVDSALRHINQFQRGMRDEDHLSQAIWNLSCVIHFQEVGREEELNDLLKL